MAASTNYAALIRLYLRPHLGQVPLAELRPGQLATLYQELLRGGGRKG